MRDVIATHDGPAAIGPYSQAIRASGFVFVSGQIAMDPVTNTLVTGDMGFQTDRVLKNLSGIRGPPEQPRESRTRDRIPEEHGRLCGDERRLRAVFSHGAAGAIDRGSRAAAERCAGRDRRDRIGVGRNSITEDTEEHGGIQGISDWKRSQTIAAAQFCNHSFANLEARFSLVILSVSLWLKVF